MRQRLVHGGQARSSMQALELEERLLPLEEQRLRLVRLTQDGPLKSFDALLQPGFYGGVLLCREETLHGTRA